MKGFMGIKKIAILFSIFLFIALATLVSASAGDAWVFNRLVRTDNLGRAGSYIPSIIVDTGIISGINATSTATFNIQSNVGINPFTISSSTGLNILTVTNLGKVGIGTSSPNAIFQIANLTTSATTTFETGRAGQGKGVCHKEYDTAGNAVYWWWVPGLKIASSTSANSCAAGF